MCVLPFPSMCPSVSSRSGIRTSWSLFFRSSLIPRLSTRNTHMCRLPWSHRVHLHVCLQAFTTTGKSQCFSEDTPSPWQQCKHVQRTVILTMYSQVESCGSEQVLLKDRAAVKDTKLSEPGALKADLRTDVHVHTHAHTQSHTCRHAL